MVFVLQQVVVALTMAAEAAQEVRQLAELEDLGHPVI
jgi:hypothetical protein